VANKSNAVGQSHADARLKWGALIMSVKRWPQVSQVRFPLQDFLDAIAAPMLRLSITMEIPVRTIQSFAHHHSPSR
jgi:hypothetical protein